MPSTAPARSRTLRIVLLVAGSLAIVLLAGYIVVGAVVASSRPDASREIVIDEPFEALDITAEVSDVIVQYGAVEAPTFTFAQNGERRSMSFDVAVSGSTLEVRVIDHGQGWRLPLEFNDAPRLTIVLPESAGPVDVVMDSDVGDVTLGGDFGDVAVTATAGDVRLKGTAESADFETTGGDLTATGYDVSGDLTIRSNAGDVTLVLDGIPSGLDVITNAGDQDVTLPRGSYDVAAHTNVGDLRVDVDGDLPVDGDPSSDVILRFEATVGDITVRN